MIPQPSADSWKIIVPLLVIGFVILAISKLRTKNQQEEKEIED